MKKRMTTLTHTNRKMNDQTYALRRKVIDIIYMAKKIDQNLPRIDVRITDCSRHNVLGTAKMNDCIIWIPAKTCLMDDKKLTYVVLHEILHAAYGVDHNETCDLMCSVYKSIEIKKALEIFRKYITK